MLILAGVSINAVIGDNGVLSKAQYSTFLNEMATVEEAVQIWKVGKSIEDNGEETTAIPANGLCKVNDLTATERLVGEIGYYRVWSIGETMPVTNILSSADTFNNTFESEFIFYPAGVQDLYYLNNEALGLNDNKVYLIDASTSIVYSMTGISLNGVRCYSTHMAKAVMGNNVEPLFVEAEVSGTGSGEVLAGNVSSEYLYDEDGNLLYNEDGTPKENPDYTNPNGFKIIASRTSNNIYKLYNNGDLYGKGIKGIDLNTDAEEMEKINPYVFKEFSIPNNIGNVKKIIHGRGGSLYFIDSSDNLWVLGNNDSNKFGLTEDQLVEFTGREAFKVDLGGKKVKKVFGEASCTYLVLEDNKLYAAGINTMGELGVGHSNVTTIFELVPNIDNAQNLIEVHSDISGNINFTMLRFNDNIFYFSGFNGFGSLGTGKTTEHYMNFVRVWDGVIGPDIDHEIKSFNTSCVILKVDGTVWVAGYPGYIQGGNLPSGSSATFRQYNNLSNIVSMDHTAFLNTDGEFYVIGGDVWSNNRYGTNYRHTYPVKVDLPTKLITEGIKEFIVLNSATIILSNSGNLYGAGTNSYLGVNNDNGATEGFIDLNISGIKSLYSSNIDTSRRLHEMLYEKDGKYFMTGNKILMFRDDILQKTWSKIASNVKFFTGKNSIYVDRQNNLYVAGSDSRILGLGNDTTKINSIESTSVDNYILHPDTRFHGKVKEAYICSANLYILTTNGEIWGTGLYEYAGGYYHAGWSENVDQHSFVKILDNVKNFYVGECDDYGTRFAIMKDGTARMWGVDYGQSLGQSSSYVATPVTFNLPEVFGGVDNIYKYHLTCSFRSFVILNSGKVYRSGSWYHMYNGGNAASYGFHEFTYGLSLAEDEKVIDTATLNEVNNIFLTNKGRVFGYGNGQFLGIGNTSTTQFENRELTGLSNVSQITAGNGFYVAVTTDGKVYGTGSNKYGILGRWIGVDRNQPNSRYKTAFEWVECPELEI